MHREGAESLAIMAAKKKKKKTTGAAGAAGEETALVPVGEQFTALQTLDNLKEVVDANFGEGGTASWSSLERIKVGTGGSLSYIIEDEIDGVTPVEEFESLICWWEDHRTWWEVPFDQGGTGGPPSCSADGSCLTGHGNNGYDEGKIDCKTCPNNRFGSNPSPKVEGHFCTKTKRMYLLRTERPGVLFPSVLIVPPGSLKQVGDYMMAITSRGLPFYAAIHTFTLTPDQNPAGIKYAKVKIGYSRKLNEDEIVMVRKYADAVQPAFSMLVPDQKSIEA